MLRLIPGDVALSLTPLAPQSVRPLECLGQDGESVEAIETALIGSLDAPLSPHTAAIAEML